MAVNEKTDSLVTKYTRGNLPNSPEALLQFIQSELVRIEGFTTASTEASIQTTDKPVVNPKRGMVRYAVEPWYPDATVTSGDTGLVIYDGTIWQSVSSFQGLSTLEEALTVRLTDAEEALDTTSDVVTNLDSNVSALDSNVSALELALRIDNLLTTLNGSITNSELAQDLQAEIDHISGTGVGSVAARLSTEATARAAALAAEAADRAEALAAEAVARATGIGVESAARAAAVTSASDALQGQINDITGIASWDSSTSYNVDDKARHDGKLWSAALENDNSEPTYSEGSSTNSDWTLTGDYSSVATTVANNSAAITAINDISADSTSAAAVAIKTLETSKEDAGTAASATSALATTISNTYATSAATTLLLADKETSGAAASALVDAKAYADGNFATSSDLTVLETTVNDETNGVAANASGLSDLTTSVSTAEGNIGTNSSAITALEGTVDDETNGVVATATALSALDTSVSTAEGNISTNSSAITALEGTVDDETNGVVATSTALSILGTSVSTAEGNISTNSSAITALETTVNDETNGVTATATGLSALQTNVSDNYATTSIVNNIYASVAAVGGSYIGKNDFSDGTDGLWASGHTGGYDEVVDVPDTHPLGRTKCYKQTNRSSYFYPPVDGGYYNTSAHGKTFRVTGYVYNASSIRAGAGLVSNNGNTGDNAYYSWPFAEAAPAESNEWLFYDHTFTVTDADSSRLRPWLFLDGWLEDGDTMEVYWTDMTLEDISSEKAASNSASAAYDSAQTATAEAEDAGEYAAATALDVISATTQAELAADAFNDVVANVEVAQSYADAAVQSAGTAETRRDEAGDHAEAARLHSITAEATALSIISQNIIPDSSFEAAGENGGFLDNSGFPGEAGRFELVGETNGVTPISGDYMVKLTGSGVLEDFADLRTFPINIANGDKFTLGFWAYNNTGGNVTISLAAQGGWCASAVPSDDEWAFFHATGTASGAYSSLTIDKRSQDEFNTEFYIDRIILVRGHHDLSLIDTSDLAATTDLIASNSASAAVSAAETASAHSVDAGNFAEAASGHVTTASTKADDAGHFADDAGHFADDASGFADDASGHADAASGHVDTAEARSDEAGDFAEAASISSVEASTGAFSGGFIGKNDFSDGDKGRWTHSYEVVNVPGTHPLGRTKCYKQTNRDAYYYPPIAGGYYNTSAHGKTFRVTGYVYNASTVEARAGLRSTNATTDSSWATRVVAPANSNEWRYYNETFTVGDADGVRMMPFLQCNGQLINGDTLRAYWTDMTLENISSEKASADFALASFTSSETATTKSGEAGDFAEAASQSEGLATLSAGHASFYANNASNSATAASGSATAAASTVNGLTARLDNAGGTGVTVEQAYSANASDIGDLEGQYTVKIDANGAVAGFGLASTTTSLGTNESEFIVNADRFALMRGGSNTTGAVTPFTVQATATTVDGVSVPAGVYMDAAFIKNASITSAKIGTLSADKITTGTLNAALFEANSIQATKLLIDNTSLTETTITSGTHEGKKALRVNAIDASDVNITNLYVDSIAGDINTLTPFKLAGPVAIEGTDTEIWTGRLAASIKAKKPYLSAVGYGGFDNNVAYKLKLQMKPDTGVVSNTVGSIHSFYAGYSLGGYGGMPAGIGFSGDVLSLLPQGLTLKIGGVAMGEVSWATYGADSGLTIAYLIDNGFSSSNIGQSVTGIVDTDWRTVSEVFLRSNYDYRSEPFAIMGGLSTGTTNAVDVRLMVDTYNDAYATIPTSPHNTDYSNDKIYGFEGLLMELR